LFLMRPEHIAMSLTGVPCWKTQTRRLWKRGRANVGAVHQLREKLFGPSKGTIKVLRVHQEHLLDITEADARKEGGYTREQFLQKWFMINPRSPPNPLVFVVDYRPT